MTRTTLSAAVLVALVGLLSACGGGGGEKNSGSGAPRPVQIQLQEQSYSGETGTVTFTAEGGKTRVVIDMPSYAANAQPAHIHPGTCAKLDPTPAYPLENVVGGKSTTVVDASLDSLLKKAYAVNLHRSARKLKTYVACGNIGGNEAPAETYTTSDEDDY